MDPTAWIVVALCVVALVLWEIYSFRQIQPRPVTTSSRSVAAPSPLQTQSPAFGSVTPTATASPAPLLQPSPTPGPTTPSFAEVTDTIRNSDLELHLTNRGGGIAKAVLLNHVAEQDRRVTLNSEEHPPIGAIVADPKAPLFPEYKMQRDGDAVLFESTTPEQVTIRKRFGFAPSGEKKDNYVAQLDLEFHNDGTAGYTNPGYYVELGSAAANHPKDYPSYTRLVWCVDGKAKGVDVGWFSGGSGFLGVGQRAPQSYYEERVAGAEWGAVTNQFFATLVAPLNGKTTSISARRFEVKSWPEFKVNGIEGALGMPGFQVAPGQSYSVRFEIYAGPKLYHRLATLSHNEAEVMEFGIFKLICQALLNALNTLHSFLGNYAA